MAQLTLKREDVSGITTPSKGKTSLFVDEADGLFKLKDDEGNVIEISGGVTSVFGRTGVVVAKAGDYSASDITGLGTAATKATGDFDAAGAAAAAAKTEKERAEAAEALKESLANKDTDTALAANSDTKYSSQKAVKAYVDALLTASDAVVYKGVLDCSSNPKYPKADAGHLYRVSVAGKIGGGSGVNVEIGDTLICITDGSAEGTQVEVGSKWNVIQANIDGAVVGPSSATSERLATFSGTTGKVIQDGGAAISTDGTFASNSDAKIPTEKAVKTYAQPLDTDLTTIGGIEPKTGMILVGSGSTWVALKSGSVGQEMVVNSDGSVSYRDPVVLNVEAWGAKPDDFYIDGEATSASKTFKSASAKFTAEDVGKTIVILRAGPSNWQDHGTTIASVKSATEVELTHAAERTQSSARFYVSRSGAQDKPIEEAIQSAYERNGSKIVYFPGVGYLTSKAIVLKHRTGIEGASRNGTMIHLAGESNCPIVRNEIIANNTAEFVKIRKIKLDGNRKRQANITTTLTAKYSAGGTELKLTDATNFFAGGGVVTIGTNRLTYQTKEGNTLKGVVGGNEGSTDATGEVGATVTQIVAVGIHLGLDPYNATPTTAEQFDPHHVIEDVFIKHTKGDGAQGWGQSETRYLDVHVAYAEEIGFRPSFDTFLTNCTTENTGRMGFFLRNSEVKASNCKAFFAGGSTAAEGHGWMLEGPTTLEEGTKVLSSCGAQDNKAHGFLLRNAQRCIIQGTASSNGTSSAGTYVGIKLEGIASLNVIDMVCTERVAEPNNTQRNALEIGAECVGNQIRITHGATGSAVVKEAIKSSSDLSGGNDIKINGMGGVKTPAFAAEYTPDPYAATTHIVGALTAAIKINKPSNAHLGCRLRFIFLQDGTGGRNITWDEAFSTTYANTGNTANKKLVIEFEYNTVSSKWQQVSMSQSATAGTYWI